MEHDQPIWKESCDNKDIYCLLKFPDSTLNGLQSQ